MTVLYIKYLSFYYALAYPLEHSTYTLYQINLQSVLVESHKCREACSLPLKYLGEEIPCHSNFRAGDKKLTGMYIQCEEGCLCCSRSCPH